MSCLTRHSSYWYLCARCCSCFIISSVSVVKITDFEHWWLHMDKKISTHIHIYIVNSSRGRRNIENNLFSIWIVDCLRFIIFIFFIDIFHSLTNNIREKTKIKIPFWSILKFAPYTSTGLLCPKKLSSSININLVYRNIWHLKQNFNLKFWS